jgi:hypothetical protein
VLICTSRSKISNRILPIHICVFAVIAVVNRCHHKPGLHKLTVLVSQNPNHRNAPCLVWRLLYDNNTSSSKKIFCINYVHMSMLMCCINHFVNLFYGSTAVVGQGLLIEAS